MKKKKIFLGISLLACAAFMASCTKATDTSTSSASSSTTSAVTETSPVTTSVVDDTTSTEVTPTPSESTTTTTSESTTTTTTDVVNQYTVVFMVDDTTYDTVTVDEGGIVKKPATPTKSGATFSYWAANGVKYDFNTKVTADLTLTAVFVSGDTLVTVGFGDGLTPWADLITDESNLDSKSRYLIGSTSLNGFNFNGGEKNVVTADKSAYQTQGTTISFTLKSAGTFHLEGKWGSSSAGGYVYLKNGSTDAYKSENYAANTTDSVSVVDFEVTLEAGTYTLSADKTITISRMYMARNVEYVNITYATAHGTEPGAIAVEKGDAIGELPTLSADGYVFKGWYLDSDYQNIATKDTVVTADTTLYAKWVVYSAEDYVTISFDEATAGVQDDIVIEKNTKVTSLPDVSKTGYVFKGWYIDADFKNEFNASANVTVDVTLYAKFVKLYTVTFQYDSTDVITTTKLEDGETIDSTVVPSAKYKSGYSFKYWSADGSTEFNLETTAITADTVLTAVYEVSENTGTVEVITSGAEQEALYAEFLAYETATEYAAYVKASDATAYTKIDNQLIRYYASQDGTYNYYRVDAVGLKAGTYSLKIVPIISNAEVESAATEVTNLTVIAHERTGYAFVSGTSSGAYDNDGVLKSDASVIYVSNSTKDTVTLGGYTGLQNIITAMKSKKYISNPVCIRIIGNITDPSVLEKGDLLIDGVTGGLTIEGIGTDATANGWGIRVKGSSNVEIRNLGVMNCNSDEGDNIGLQQDNDHIWVHNCDLFYGDAGGDADQAKGDGALDTKTSTYVTHSFNHFWDSGKCNLQGMKSESTTNYITYHHNWYDHSDSRHPRIRTCTVHIYNNYFDGNAKYGVGVTSGASAFVENNYFRTTATMRPMMSSLQGTDAAGDGTFSGEDGGMIKSYGNTFDGNVSYITYQQNNTSFDAYEATSRDEQVASSIKTLVGGTTYNNFDTAADMYSYTVETPEQAKATVTKYAGRVQGGDFKWTFDNATEDSNYAVITGLKSALTSYTGYLKSIQSIGEESSSGGSGSGSSTTTTTADDVIALIAALPEATAVTESDRTAINAANTAYNSLSTTEQANVTNYDKLAACIAALPVQVSAGTISFNDKTVSISGSLDTTATIGGYKKLSDLNLTEGVTYNSTTYDVAAKFDSKSSISLTLTSASKVKIYMACKAVGNKLKVGDETITTTATAITEYSLDLSAGTYSIVKNSGELYIFLVVVE